MPEPSLHHVGYIVPSIADSVEQWRRVLSAVTTSEIYSDKIQRVRAVFLGFPPQGAVQFELIEPDGENSPVLNQAQKGGGMHHLCFEVDDLEQHVQQMKKLRATLIAAPQPAIAFGGRRIAWMFLRERMLVEYLERQS